MVLTSIAQAESPRHDGIALTPVYAHQKRSDNIYTWTALHVLTHMYTTLGTQLVEISVFCAAWLEQSGIIAIRSH